MMQPSTSYSPTPVIKQEPGVNKPIDRAHTDTVLNFLLRLACQVNDSTPQNPANPTASSPGELLSRRCVILLKTALKPDIWPQPVDLKLAFFDKILLTVEAPNPNIGNVCTALELLTYLLTVLKKDQILASFKPLQRGLGELEFRRLRTWLIYKPERVQANLDFKRNDVAVSSNIVIFPPKLDMFTKF